MSVYMMAGASAFISMADERTAQLIAATQDLATHLGGAIQAEGSVASNVGFGAGINLDGFGR